MVLYKFIIRITPGTLKCSLRSQVNRHRQDRWNVPRNPRLTPRLGTTWRKISSALRAATTAYYGRVCWKHRENKRGELATVGVVEQRNPTSHLIDLATSCSCWLVPQPPGRWISPIRRESLLSFIVTRTRSTEHTHTHTRECTRTVQSCV